jgi:hypothetical protein
MQRICEDEHARNLANFDVLIARITEFRRSYKPAKPSIQLEALAIVSQNAKIAITNVVELMHEYVALVNMREAAFENLKLLNQRLFKELTATSAINETEIYMLLGAGKVPYSQFASQERYDFLVENFCRIIKLIKTNSFYMPTQTELNVATLEDSYASIYLKNNEVKRTAALLSNACSIRDEVMYRNVNGLVVLAATVRMYIKYHFGWESKQYKQISGLMIKKPRAN